VSGWVNNKQATVDYVQRFGWDQLRAILDSWSFRSYGNGTSVIAKPTRNILILHDRLNGMTRRQVSKKYNISYQRACQLSNKMFSVAGFLIKKEQNND
jgi:hypothetical protein